jgi:hypothetical protein
MESYEYDTLFFITYAQVNNFFIVIAIIVY